jgi:hypothetical protein
MQRAITPGDRVLLLVSLVLLGAVLASLTRFPVLERQVDVLGSPLGLALDGRSVIGGLLVLLTAAGVDGLVRTEAGRQRADVRFTATFWILPCLIALAIAITVPRQYAATEGWLASLVLLGALLTVVILAEYRTIRLDSPQYRTARLALNVATYGAAFALYSTIYGLQLRSLVSAPLAMLVTFPLALELLRSTEEQLERTWLYAGVVTLVLGELTWAINALGLRALSGGGILLLAFYALAGVVQQHLAERLNRRVATEFALTALVGLGLIWLSAP